MKKQWFMALAMLLCLCLLTACQTSEPEKFTVKTAGGNAQTQQTQQTAQNQPAGEEYDPLEEEDDYSGDLDYWQGEIATPVPVTPTPAPTVRSDYAGATPVPVDPIDLPTPTAAPPLPQFSYKTYDATKLGLSFDGPTGWLVDESAADYYIIQNPNAAVSYPATLTVHAEKVSAQYSENDLKTVIRNMLNAIGQSAELAEYSPSNTASRPLLGASGIYANYTGVLDNGVEIAGRVHATCVEKVLYTVHITYPREYTEGYKEQVYDKLRDTIQITK